jgi:2'-5' RNA ligase
MKVGVNIPITEPALTACLKINSEIASLTQSLVVFGPDGNSSPHVTIAMGSIESDDLMAQVEAVLQNLTRNLPSTIQLDFGPVYRESLTGHYVFSDVLFSDAMADWRAKAQRALHSLFIEPARTSDVPHLTLGHVSADFHKVDDYAAQLAESIPPCDATSIDISRSGSKGIKLKVLRRVSINE